MIEYHEASLEEWWSFLDERHAIWRRRQNGVEWPWTDDPILRAYRFTNLFRELDKTTVWFRTHVREPMAHSPLVAPATIAFRWFNRIETGETLLENGLFENWDSDRAWEILAKKGPPYVTGAYIIKSPTGMEKLEGVLSCIDQAHWYLARKQGQWPTSLREFWSWLTTFNHLGPFMAYEAVTDLRHTSVLRNAPDIMTWANAGPGAIRGVHRMLWGTKDKHERRVEYNMVMVDLLARWMERARPLPPGSSGLELRDVEHSLCEFDKYMRTKNGEGRPRQSYGR